MEFERKDTPTVMDGMVVRWKGMVEWRNYPEISASRNGVCISGGWPTLGYNDIESIKAKLDEAYTKHQELQQSRGR